MSNFGKKYNPNKRAYNKAKRDHTIDLLRIKRESNKPNRNYKSRYKTRRNSISIGMVILIAIILLLFKM